MRVITLSLVLFAAVSCASSPKPPVATGPGATQPESKAEPSAQPSGSAVAIHIDPSIQKACGIDHSKAWFDFDSADLKQKDIPVLDAVAACFDSGPLKGKAVLLVGHADPRGEFEYNMLLGERRAGSVKEYVVDRGLSGAKITTSSRGEMDARGTDEPTWAEDRRVDVRLAN